VTGDGSATRRPGRARGEARNDLIQLLRRSSLTSSPGRVKLDYLRLAVLCLDWSLKLLHRGQVPFFVS